MKRTGTDADIAAAAAPGDSAVGGASGDDERGPLRRCVATGAVQSKEGMIRFVIGPDGTVVPDVEERLPGRGVWVSASAGALSAAAARNLFAKSARRAVRVEPDLVERVGRLLERRCLDAVGLARRAGQVVAGFEKASEALRRGRVSQAGPPALLLEAADGSPDQRAKMTALAPGLPVVDLFGSADLAAALGREIAVHAVVARGRLADAILRDAGRLAGVRDTTMGIPAARKGPRPGKGSND